MRLSATFRCPAYSLPALCVTRRPGATHTLQWHRGVGSPVAVFLRVALSPGEFAPLKERGKNARQRGLVPLSTQPGSLLHPGPEGHLNFPPDRVGGVWAFGWCCYVCERAGAGSA